MARPTELRHSPAALENRDRGVPGAEVRFGNADGDPAEGRRISARVLTYGTVDDYNTVFAPGVFSESLSRRMPKIVFSHNWDQPIGRWLDWEEDSRGLILHGELDDAEFVPLAGQVAYQLRVGTLDQFSVGFTRQADRDGSEEYGPGVRVITKGELAETSPVLVGAVRGTELLAIRSGGDAPEPAVPGFPGLSVRMPGQAEGQRLLVPVEDVTRIVLQMQSGDLDLADGLSAIKGAAFLAAPEDAVEGAESDTEAEGEGSQEDDTDDAVEAAEEAVAGDEGDVEDSGHDDGPTDDELLAEVDDLLHGLGS
jgi:HK97 family phage prohead protease